MKKVLIALLVAVALAIPINVLALTADTPASGHKRGSWGIDASKLTTSQKADLLAGFKKIAEAKKDLVKKMMENGAITKEQGEARIKAIDEMIQYREKNGFTGGGPGMGKGQGFKKEKCPECTPGSPSKAPAQ